MSTPDVRPFHAKGCVGSHPAGQWCRDGEGTTLRDFDDQGWASLPPARKFHYYQANGRSLCAKWQAFLVGNLEAFSLTDTAARQRPRDAKAHALVPTPDDCATCRKRLDRRGVR